MSEKVGSIHYVLGIDTGPFDKAVAGVKGQMANVGSSMTSMGKTMSLGITLPVVAGAAVAVKAALESRKVASQTEAVIKSTGGVANYTAAQVETLAKSMQKTTLYTDEQVASSQNMLLTFTRIGGETMPRATKAVADMATAMGTDLTSTSIQVGKALQDPINGVTALQRVGVRLTEQQKDQVKAMVEAGDTAGAQALILKELETEFGGSANAAALAVGPMDKLKDMFDDLSESVGESIIPILDKLSQKLSSVIAWFDGLSPKTKSMILIFLGIAAALGPVLIVVGMLVTAIGALISPVTLIILGIGLLIAGIVYLQLRFQLFTPIIQFFTALFALAWSQLKIAFEQARAALEPYFPQLMLLGKIIMVAVVVPLGIMVGAILTAIAVITVIVVVVARLIGWLVQLGAAWMRLYGMVWNATSGIRNAVFGVLGNLGSWLYSSGQRLIQGFVDGIKSHINKPAEVIRNGLSSLRRLLPFSPAKEGPFSGKGWTLYSGQSIMTGFADGITSMADAPQKAIDSALNSAVGGTAFNANANVSLGGVSAAQTTTNETTISGNIYLQDASAVDAFFTRLNRNNELTQKGLATA